MTVAWTTHYWSPLGVCIMCIITLRLGIIDVITHCDCDWLSIMSYIGAGVQQPLPWQTTPTCWLVASATVKRSLLDTRCHLFHSLTNLDNFVPSILLCVGKQRHRYRRYSYGYFNNNWVFLIYTNVYLYIWILIHILHYVWRSEAQRNGSIAVWSPRFT